MSETTENYVKTYKIKIDKPYFDNIRTGRKRFEILTNRRRKTTMTKKALKTKVKTKSPQAVLVTTEFRGVFFGYVKDDKEAPAQITLTGVRNCIYWHSSCGGFLGLASNGPTSNCKIGKRVDECTIYKITSVTPVQDSAIAGWEKA